ncbi:MAG TPA: hypothetical protein VFG50_13155 [Rhodothermales bacterium]|nr:hypothetical protein [Rhodothermales bacterium]
MRIYVNLIALVVVAVCLGGCSLFGGGDADVDLHHGIATGIRVGERLYAPESTLRGCQPSGEKSTRDSFICTSGPHAGLLIRMAGDVHDSKVLQIVLTSDFQGTVEEGVGIGTSSETVRKALGPGVCSGASAYSFGAYGAMFDYDPDARVFSITLVRDQFACAY